MIAPASSRNLVIYESQELVGNLITHRKPKLTKPGVKKRARAVSAYVRQGRQLLEISSEADLIVRPILQYYGIVALCRGLIVIHSGISPDSLKPKHGAEVSYRKSRDLSNVRVNLSGDGTIPTVIPILEEFNRVQVQHWTGYDPAVGTQSDAFPSIDRTVYHSLSRNQPETAQSSISVEQFLARIPEVEEEYGAAFQTDPCYVTSRVIWAEPSGNVEIVADKPLDHEFGREWADGDEFQRAFGIPSGFDVRRITDHSLSGLGPGMSMISVEDHEARTWPMLYSFTEVWGHVVERRTVLVRPINGLYLSPLTLMLIASFVLSCIARYHPEEWRETILGAEHDRLLPITKRLMDVIDRQLVDCIALAYGQHHLSYHIDSAVRRVLSTAERSNESGNDGMS